MASRPFYMRGGRVLFSVRGTGIVPWLIVLFMLALFAFGLVLLIKGADIFLTHFSSAQPCLNKFVDANP